MKFGNATVRLGQATSSPLLIDDDLSLSCVW
jgi:hypothetical protein